MSEPNKSELSSWEMWVEQLTSLPEDLQLQELLIKTKEQQQQILTLLSEKSELQSLVQELQSQIQTQSEEIAKQNSSDQMLTALHKEKRELAKERDLVDRQTQIIRNAKNALEADKKDISYLVRNAVKGELKRYRTLVRVLSAGVILLGMIIIYFTIQFFQ